MFENILFTVELSQKGWSVDAALTKRINPIFKEETTS